LINERTRRSLGEGGVEKTLDNFSTVVLAPIYKEKLSHNETLAMLHSFSVLERHDLFFVCPAGLDTGFYHRTFPRAKYAFFDAGYFASTDSYSKLLLSPAFYQAFPRYTHMLIVQSDCVVLRDDLDYWMASPFDYVGAPWPKTWEFLFPKLSSPFDGTKFYVPVGNGGLSLRRTDGVLQVLDELSWFVDKCAEVVEDAFFSIAGHLSHSFMVPNTVQAARFSIECEPRRFHAVAGMLPMGTHAWEKWDKPFWLDVFDKAGLRGFV